MRVRCCGLVALALVLVAASVAPVGAVTDSGASGGGLVAADPGGFSDVSGVHAPAVEVLAAEGVFDGTGSGCGDGLFCPSDPILRWEMAVWLVRVLDGTEPDAASSSRFADVDTDVWWVPHVERFAELNVTRGCGTDPLRFCPHQVAPRAQMASFLARAFDLPPGPPAGFTDVAVGETHAANIDALAASRVTAGCSPEPLQFCPERKVTRAQMATFLARAAGLVDLPELPALTPANSITVGFGHSCALRAAGTAQCCGKNSSGQATPPGGVFTAITAGFDHTCALRTDRLRRSAGALLTRVSRRHLPAGSRP